MPKALPKRFTDVTAARKHLEALLWPEGPICPHCEAVNVATALKGKSTRPGVYWCNACQKPFSVTVGTVFERSKVPLNTWLYANHLLMGASKKGISSQQLARMLGVTVKTAWFMSHRIRHGVTPVPGSEPPLGGDGFVVEADETELSKSHKSRPRARKDNLKFVSLVERGGRVRSRRIRGKGMISLDVHKALYTEIDRASTLHTDGAKHYAYSLFRETHEAVDHSKEFVREGKTDEKVHVNSAEGYFSIFKRGLVGVYQHMSEQHLAKYLAEFDHRMSYRAKLGYTDDMRADKALEGIVGKRLTYRRPNGTSDDQATGAGVSSLA